MTQPHNPGPDEGRGIAGQLIYDLSFATVDKATFNELVALMRDGAPRKPPTPEASWRRAYHEAMFNRRLVGVQHDLFGGKPTTHMHKAKPGRPRTGNPSRSRRSWRGSRATLTRRSALADRY